MNLDLATGLATELANTDQWPAIMGAMLGALLAGAIDSIVGGGGLITVPILLSLLGPNASAIGTNKVAAIVAQLAAFFVYFRNRQVDLSVAPQALFFTAFGAILGALLAPQLPREFFQWFLVVIAPLVLALVFTRSLWTRNAAHRKRPRLAILGCFGAGLYDGVAGPGGGTLMFISLFWLGGLPAAFAIGTGKLANLGSATTSLITFGAQGEVNWWLGTLMALPIAIGAWFGATISSGKSTIAHEREERARKVSRLALAIVSTLLVVRWLLLNHT